MSGASGKIPAAIHVTPEASLGGPIARLRDGDIIRVDCTTGTLTALVDPAEFAARALPEIDLSASHSGLGRELFSSFRHAVSGAASGASVFA
jgi:phosphogluconate dehydratase